MSKYQEALDKMLDTHNELLEKYNLGGGFGNLYITVKEAIDKANKYDEMIENIKEEVNRLTNVFTVIDIKPTGRDERIMVGKEDVLKIIDRFNDKKPQKSSTEMFEELGYKLENNNFVYSFKFINNERNRVLSITRTSVAKTRFNEDLGQWELIAIDAKELPAINQFYKEKGWLE